jgi:hypothetical protein
MSAVNAAVRGPYQPGRVSYPLANAFLISMTSPLDDLDRQD